MRYIFLCCGLFISALLSAQSKQFEGEIHYLHLFHFKEANADSSAIIKAFGSSSKYYYKNGFYKWTFETSNMEVEYHNGETGIVHDKYRGNDTLYYTTNDFTDTILRYEILKNADTICGYVCDRLKVLIGKTDNPESALLRYISYSRELPLDPVKFKDFDAFCTNEVFKITGSLPLRIVMETPYWPFTMRFEAIKVVRREMDEKEINLPAGSVFKSK